MSEHVIFTDGDDIFESFGGDNVAYMLGGNDTAFGGEGDDQIYGGSGNDELDGFEGDDRLDGGSGNDELNGGVGDDSLYGGSGDDSFTDVSGDNFFSGGSGVDTVHYGSATSAVTVDLDRGRALRGTEVDVLKSIENVDGSAFDDTIHGDERANKLRGNGGNDTYYVATGDQVIEAGGGGTDTVRAAGNFSLGAGQEIELLIADAGSIGLTLTGNGFDNRIMGGDGDDALTGSGGNDVLTGGLGKDTLKGGSGDDTLDGGEGKADKLLGGAGADAFVLRDSYDIVLDFDGALDSIRIDHLVCPGLATGPLDPAHFAVGSATGSGPQIVYNDVNGRLFFDSNGALAGGAVQIAILDGAPDLAASDIKVI